MTEHSTDLLKDVNVSALGVFPFKQTFTKAAFSILWTPRTFSLEEVYGHTIDYPSKKQPPQTVTVNTSTYRNVCDPLKNFYTQVIITIGKYNSCSAIINPPPTPTFLNLLYECIMNPYIKLKRKTPSIKVYLMNVLLFV